MNIVISHTDRLWIFTYHLNALTYHQNAQSELLAVLYTDKMGKYWSQPSPFCAVLGFKFSHCMSRRMLQKSNIRNRGNGEPDSYQLQKRRKCLPFQSQRIIKIFATKDCAYIFHCTSKLICFDQLFQTTCCPFWNEQLHHYLWIHRDFIIGFYKAVLLRDHFHVQQSSFVTEHRSTLKTF